MNQAQINEILDHQKEFLNAIDKTLAKDLLPISWEVDALKDKIISGLRWGMFLRKNCNGSPDVRTAIEFKNENYPYYEPLVRINFHEIRSLEEDLSLFGILKRPIFSPKINKKHLGREIKVFLDYDSLEPIITEVISTFKRSDTAKLLKHYELRLTLPEPGEVFGVKDIYSISDSQIDNIDAYEKWKWKMEQTTNKYGMSYLQIGGHGNWVQGSYDDTYIAQVNNDIGDCGSVFITVKPDGEFQAWVDMC